eukprot:TRINITY_DN26569_c0_g1_i1.p1 TRINITY_DN26569_c0_g1~~TRINITY_DN26569_c0_g1_i1.p1  ORF type:complete len:238 (+),score=64.91 TRINITY_DN26569_c0_g1_i1:111-824(+)
MGCQGTKASLPVEEEIEADAAESSTKRAEKPNKEGDAGADDDDWKALLSPTPGVAPPAGLPAAPKVAASESVTAPRAAQQRSQGSASKPPSAAAKRAAARLGVPLPSDEDQPYGLMDEYMDDLLGIDKKDRDSNWKRPSLQETESALRELPQIVYQDGSKGPSHSRMPRKEILVEENASKVEKKGSGSTPAATPYLSGVLNNWAEIDSSSKVETQTVQTTQVGRDTRDRPAPKRKAQ